MTLKRAERLTGYEIRLLRSGQGQVTYGAFELTKLIIKASGRVEWMALKALVERVYKLHCRVALQNHNWRCARCRSSRQLQIHHRRYRSHGGTHQVENLEPVCWDCHRMIHARERSR